MNTSINYRKSRFVIGFLSLFSLAFLTNAPFETNPQNCEMVNLPEKKKKEKQKGDKDYKPLSD